MAFIHASFQRRAYDIRTERRIKKNMLDNSIIMICAEERQEKKCGERKKYLYYGDTTYCTTRPEREDQTWRIDQCRPVPPPLRS